MVSPTSPSADLIHYVTSLSESRDPYERFFDALLIKRRQHAAIFRDLRAFRSQPHIIQLLLPGSKDSYREVTRQYLASRYAHPWCRTAPLREGWFKAEWGSIKKAPDGAVKEEERLHRLLLPIWCRFRGRVMPSEEQMDEFLVSERARGARGESSVPERESEIETFLDDDSDDGILASAKMPTAPDDEAKSVARVFIGMAAAGKLMEDKRVRKYLMRKMKATN